MNNQNRCPSDKDVCVGETIRRTRFKCPSNGIEDYSQDIVRSWPVHDICFVYDSSCRFLYHVGNRSALRIRSNHRRQSICRFIIFQVHYAGPLTFCAGLKMVPIICAQFVLTDGTIRLICATLGSQHKLFTFSKLVQKSIFRIFVGKFI